MIPEDIKKLFDGTDPAPNGMEEGFYELFSRRIENRYGYRIEGMSTGEHSIFDDILNNPDDPQENSSWQPIARLRKAERAFLLIMGVWSWLENNPASHWKSRLARRWREQIESCGLLPCGQHCDKEQQDELIEAGKDWLNELRWLT